MILLQCEVITGVRHKVGRDGRLTFSLKFRIFFHKIDYILMSRRIISETQELMNNLYQ